MYTIGIDYGSNAVRVLLANAESGHVVATAAVDYGQAEAGVYTDATDDNIARQDARDYMDSLVKAFKDLKANSKLVGFDWNLVRGIGVDATGSTPIPVTKEMKPISSLDEFRNNLNAKAWMWKDHTSEEEALKITRLAKELRPDFMKTCGGKYSSEWFWAKVWHCANVDQAVFDAAYTWVEFSDYIPAVLCGITNATDIKRNACAAGHKALYNSKWGGYPDKEFIQQLDKRLVKVVERLPEKALSVNQLAGYLCDEWAEILGLPKGIAVAIGALDAHVGAIGSGVNNQTLVKIIGTSTCDIIVGNDASATINGVSGIAEDSVIPGFLGIEAGQSAVGDIFKWFVEGLLGKDGSSHKELTEKAEALKPAQSGLLALDWNNGNRNILGDPNLRGMIVGQSLHTKDYEVYRALIEATAFGARRIIDQLESAGVTINRIVCCGGIPQKNKLFMQIYTDVLNRPVEVAESDETVALGAAMIGALAAAQNDGERVLLTDLQKRFCKTGSLNYQPEAENVTVYNELYQLYLLMHDAFGTTDANGNLYSVMKQLIQLKNRL
ncbi:MAG: ribulokinase [Bacteroidales bacterium]|nr:ribulokinase [Bacteroidales bacterium]